MPPAAPPPSPRAPPPPTRRRRRRRSMCTRVCDMDVQGFRSSTLRSRSICSRSRISGINPRCSKQVVHMDIGTHHVSPGKEQQLQFRLKQQLQFRFQRQRHNNTACRRCNLQPHATIWRKSGPRRNAKPVDSVVRGTFAQDRGNPRRRRRRCPICTWV